MKRWGKRFGAILGAAFVLMMPLGTKADPIADFYKGKSIDFIIGAAVGGAYDLPGRLVAHRLGDHIPGQPPVVVRNMEGGNGLRMTNTLYNIMCRPRTAP